MSNNTLRELKSMVFDAMTRHTDGNLSLASFRNQIATAAPGADNNPAQQNQEQDFQLSGRFPTLKEIEQHLIAEALKLSGGNQGAAAMLLGLTRQALNKRLCRK